MTGVSLCFDFIRNQPSRLISGLNFSRWRFAGFCVAALVFCLSAADVFADTISGTVYSDEGTTNIGASQTVSVSINGAAVAASADTDASGVYSIPGITINSGDVLTLYLNDETADAVTVTVGDGNDLSGVDLYQNYLITRHDNGG